MKKKININERGFALPLALIIVGSYDNYGVNIGDNYFKRTYCKY